MPSQETLLLETKKAKVAMFRVKSSNVELVGYDTDSRTLYIRFHSSKDVYSYKNVPPKTAAGLISAKSVGSYFHAHVKDSFEAEQIEAPRIGKVKKYER